SSGGIPLSLFLLLRGYRRSSQGLVIAGWLVAAWQVSLGFTLGLQFAYLLAVLALIAVVWWWRTRPNARARSGTDPLPAGHPAQSWTDPSPAGHPAGTDPSPAGHPARTGADPSPAGHPTRTGTIARI